MKAKELRHLLEKQLGYEVTRQHGSHAHLVAEGRESVTFAYHDHQELSAGQVKHTLVQTGISREEALELMKFA